MSDIFEGELGPMPEGIDLDVPYSLQFALAQKGQVVAPSEMGDGQVGTVERSDDWIDEYIGEILAGIDRDVDPDESFKRYLK